jgi:hypothetical protein
MEGTVIELESPRTSLVKGSSNSAVTIKFFGLSIGFGLQTGLRNQSLNVGIGAGNYETL